MDYLKVSSKSSPASVAGAIAGLIKNGAPVDLQAIGAGAVNQAMKAIAISRSFLIPCGIDVCCTPSFHDVEIDGQSRTALRISVCSYLIQPDLPACLAKVSHQVEPKTSVQTDQLSSDCIALPDSLTESSRYPVSDR